MEIIEESSTDATVVEYLKEPPDAATILRIAELLGIAVADLLRRGEAAFREASDLPPLDDDIALAAWIAEHPIVLERPIVVDAREERAVIGRPPENVRELLGP